MADCLEVGYTPRVYTRACVGIVVSLLSLLTAMSCAEANTVTALNSACIWSVDDEVLVEVKFRDCLSSSCDTLEETSCELTREDDVITVTGEAVISTKKIGLSPCTLDCERPEATCSLKVPPGEYTVRGAYDDVVINHPLAENAGTCRF